jgi:hypothetical protein
VALPGSVANADTASRGRPISISVTTSTATRQVLHGSDEFAQPFGIRYSNQIVVVPRRPREMYV